MREPVFDVSGLSIIVGVIVLFRSRSTGMSARTYSKRTVFVYTRRLPPRAASAACGARLRGRIEQNANETDREVHHFRCKLTTCKCQELPCSRKTTRTPHACTKLTKYIEKGRRERVVLCDTCILLGIDIGNRSQSFAHHASYISCFVKLKKKKKSSGGFVNGCILL